MLPIPITRCPDTITSQHAEQVHDLVTSAYERLFGRENRLPGRGWPVVCANAIGGFWQLECNDPEIPRESLERMVEESIRPWLTEMVSNFQISGVW